MISWVLLVSVGCGEEAAELPDAAVAPKGICIRQLQNYEKTELHWRCDVDAPPELCKATAPETATYDESSSCPEQGFTTECKEESSSTWYKQEYVATFPMKEDQLCGSSPALGPCKGEGEECSVFHCYGPGLTIPASAKECASTADCDYGYACMESYQDPADTYCLMLCADTVPGGGGANSDACDQCKRTCSGQGSWCQCDEECG